MYINFERQVEARNDPYHLVAKNLEFDLRDDDVLNFVHSLPHSQ